MCRPSLCPALKDAFGQEDALGLPPSLPFPLPATQGTLDAEFSFFFFFKTGFLWSMYVAINENLRWVVASRTYCFFF